MPPLLGAFLAVLFWGASFVATKAAVAEVSPFTLIFLRAGLGSALLWPLLAARGVPLVPPRDCWRTLALMAFVGVAFHQLLQAYALTMTTAVKTGWLIGLTPVWSAVLARVVLGERLSGGRLGGLALGFVGAAVVVTGGRLDAAVLALPSTTGDLLIVLSGLNWAAYMVIGRPTLRRLGALHAMAAAMAGGSLMLAPGFVAVAGWRDLARLSGTGWLAVLFLGVFCSGLGYLFWFGALKRMEASRVAALLYLEPLVTLASAVVLLGERVTLATSAGGALLLAGVAVVQFEGALPRRLSTGASDTRAG